MYELKTLLPQFDIQLPTSMYAVRNVSLSADATDGGRASKSPSSATGGQNGVAESETAPSVRHTTATTRAEKNMCALDLDTLGRQIQQILKASAEDAAVLARQEKVLQQLKDLQGQMALIRSRLGLCQKGVQHTTGQRTARNGGLKEVPLHDVVINGHPNWVPHALLALKNAWKDLFTIDVQTFTHSTMADIGPAARAFEEKLRQVPVDETKPKVKVTLIWKNCEHTEMISSPTMYVPIYGEVNILRYLGRIGPDAYRYEDSPLVNEIDAVLDICYQLLRCTTTKTKAAMLRLLNNRLHGRQYFGGECMSIADIGVHSSLLRMGLTGDKELTPALRDWQKRAKVVTLL